MAVVEDGVRRLLVGREGLRFIKRRFSYFYVAEGTYADKEELAMLQRPYSQFIDHDTCLKP